MRSAVYQSALILSFIKQQAASSKQQAASSKQQAASSKQQAASFTAEINGHYNHRYEQSICKRVE
jgi:hypothetical protein